MFETLVAELLQTTTSGSEVAGVIDKNCFCMQEATTVVCTPHSKKVLVYVVDTTLHPAGKREESFFGSLNKQLPGVNKWLRQTRSHGFL